jgi:ketosteroid isomerase-like protein
MQITASELRGIASALATVDLEEIECLLASCYVDQNARTSVFHRSSAPFLQAQADVRAVIGGFLAAFGDRDFAVFMPYFSEDATVFFPPSAAAPSGRVRGRPSIEQAFKAVFDRYPSRSAATRTPIAPQELLVQEFDSFAIVTFELGSGPARQRRTFVLRRIDGSWRIVHLHGSSFDTPQ